jgi:hypothetical protein
MINRSSTVRPNWMPRTGRDLSLRPDRYAAQSPSVTDAKTTGYFVAAGERP